MEYFILIFAVISTAFACPNTSLCTECTKASCQFAIFNDGNFKCAEKIVVHSSVLSVAKKIAHCKFFSDIQKVSVTTTPTTRRSVYWRLGGTPAQTEKEKSLLPSSVTNDNKFLMGGTTTTPHTTLSVESVAFPSPQPQLFTTLVSDKQQENKFSNENPSPTSPTKQRGQATVIPLTPPQLSSTVVAEEQEVSLLDITPLSIEVPATTPTPKSMEEFTVIPSPITITHFNSSIPKQTPLPTQPAFLADETDAQLHANSQSLNKSRCIVEHPSTLFTSLEMFSLVNENTTCANVAPEFRYMRCLCTLNNYQQIFGKRLDEHTYSYLQLNPSKRHTNACQLLDKLRPCNATKRPTLPLKQPISRRTPFEIFQTISFDKTCSKNGYMETLHETVVKLLCRMESTAAQVNWYNFSLQDFSFFALNPAKYHRHECRAVLFRRKKCFLSTVL